MKQIYRFDLQTPPTLTEALLRRELEKRRRSRQFRLLAAAGGLIQLCMLLLGFRITAFSPALGAAVLGYAVLSAVGSGLLTAIVLKKMKGAFSL